MSTDPVIRRFDHGFPDPVHFREEGRFAVRADGMVGHRDLPPTG